MNIYREIITFLSEPLIEETETIAHFYWRLKTKLYYGRFFGHIGARSRILKPLRLKNVENIKIGSDVLIHKQCWLQTQRISENRPELIIGDGCTIGNFNHITCADCVRLEAKVLTADRVFITDHGHRFDDPRRPIMDQALVTRGPTVVGAGSWLGENVAVISCQIGKNCVIGANSVVLHDIPDYSVAVGAPARVIRTVARAESEGGLESGIKMCVYSK